MFERYASYKPSGVEWLGGVPDGWSIVRAKDICKILVPQRNKPDLNESTGLPWVTTDLLNSAITDLSKIVYFVKNEEILTSKIRPIPAYSILATCIGDLGLTSINKFPVIINQQIQAYSQILNNSLRFVNYQIQSSSSKDYYERVATETTLKYLNREKFSLLPLVIPPLTEQKTIADYLDHKTRQIDQEINLLTQKAEQYSKLKQSLINETVTHGLDKTVTMKDSGIEWIGDIPEHWDVKRIKTICTIFNGATPKSSIEENWGGNISWVTTDDLGKLKSKYVEVSKRTLTDKGYATSGTTICNAGSIVISGRAPIGHIGILSIPACTNQGCKTLVLNSKITNNLYIYYSLLASKPKLEALGRGTTFIELSTKALGLFQLPLPPLMEQEEIAKHLEDKTSQIDQITQTTNHKISTLKELRKTLINDVVTGKIKVV